MSDWAQHGTGMHFGGAMTTPDWGAHARLSRGIAERAERFGDDSLAAYLREAAAKLERRAAQTVAARGLRR